MYGIRYRIMKKEKRIPSEIKETTWFCDICEKQIAKHDPRSVCDHCGKDLCGEHSKYFTRHIDWQRGFDMHVGPKISICLCPECRVITMTYEEFLDLFLQKEMKLRTRPVGI